MAQIMVTGRWTLTFGTGQDGDVKGRREAGPCSSEGGPNEPYGSQGEVGLMPGDAGRNDKQPTFPVRLLPFPQLKYISVFRGTRHQQPGVRTGKVWEPGGS